MSQNTSPAKTDTLSKTATVILFITSLLTYAIGASFYSLSNFTLIVIAANLVFFISHLTTTYLNKMEKNNDSH